VEQTLVLRWVPHDQLTDLYTELTALKLNQPGASRIEDVDA
jgi:hypothetical protein